MTSSIHRQIRAEPGRAGCAARGNPCGPGLRAVLHGPDVPGQVDARGELVVSPRPALRAADPRPGHGRPALCRGGLRRHQGLRTRRWLDLAVPTRGERGAYSAVGAPARVPELPTDWFLGSIAALWRPTGHGFPPGEERASTCGRSCSPPSGSSASARPARHLLRHASPAGAYFPGGVKPVDIWLSTG